MRTIKYLRITVVFFLPLLIGSMNVYSKVISGYYRDTSSSDFSQIYATCTGNKYDKFCKIEHTVIKKKDTYCIMNQSSTLAPAREGMISEYDFSYDENKEKFYVYKVKTLPKKIHKQYIILDDKKIILYGSSEKQFVFNKIKDNTFKSSCSKIVFD